MTRHSDVLTTPPENYRPLADYARSVRSEPDTARRAARRGKIPGAVRVHLPGTPEPVWWVPADCTWTALKRGRPNGKRKGDHSEAAEV